jgi:hypothetical protein
MRSNLLTRLAGVGRRTAAAPARWALLTTLDTALFVLDDVLASPLTKEAADRILASPVAEDVLERIVGRALDSPEAERLVRRLIDSRLVETAMLELLENEGLWMLVGEIAQSPAVTAAIGQQGVGFANQMAGVVRQRSLSADDRLERLARRFARRAPRTVTPEDGEPAPAE